MLTDSRTYDRHTCFAFVGGGGKRHRKNDEHTTLKDMIHSTSCDFSLIHNASIEHIKVSIIVFDSVSFCLFLSR